MKLGTNLQYLRKLNGNMTQERLAERMNVSRQTVSKWENSEAIPDVDKLLELSSLFSCTLDALLKEDLGQQPTIFLPCPSSPSLPSPWAAMWSSAPSRKTMYRCT